MRRLLAWLFFLVLAASCASMPQPTSELPSEEPSEEHGNTQEQDPRARGTVVPDLCGPDTTGATDCSSSRILVDDADREQVEITAFWQSIPSEETGGGYGPTVLSDRGVGADGVVRFRPDLERAGRYEVFLYWPELLEEGRELATNAPVTVRHAGGTASFTVDLRRHAQTWKPLGIFRFDPEDEAYVEIRNDAADGIVLADAVLFRPVDEGDMENGK